jgi:Peptidase A4 family
MSDDAHALSRYKTFDPPPSDFDPFAAPDHLFRRYGLPRRPDPKTESRLSELWLKAQSRIKRIIKAELAVGPPRVRRNRLRTTQADFDISGGWAGAVVDTSSLGLHPAELANTVYGEWRVPVVAPPANPQPFVQYTVGCWVGLNGDISNTASDNVLQAGTEAVIQNGIVTYSAFFEWWDTVNQWPAVLIPNLSVSPGDYVTCLVCAPQTDEGFVSMLNVTTGVATSVAVPPPPNITSDGSSAEWIVEGDPPVLLDFFSVIFGHCSAGTQNNTFDLTHAYASNIISSDGVTQLASAGLINSTAVGVVWNAPGP